MDEPMEKGSADSELIRRAQDDPAEFRHLYDRWIDRIYRYVYSRVGRAAEAEDLTAQVFLQAYQALPRYRQTGRFEGWLFAIARNQLRMFFRKPKREIPLDGMEVDSGTADLLTQTAHAEQIRRLRTLVRRLSADEQELIRLRYAVALNFAEIAIILGKKEDAVKKKLYRLQDWLQRQMEELHE